MSKITGAWTSIHTHEDGIHCLAAAWKRNRNTTLAIGVDQDSGTLLVDFDVQDEICSDVNELKAHLKLLLECLDGADAEAMLEPGDDGE